MRYPKIYNDPDYNYALRNAMDCLYFGYGKNYWNDCKINPSDRTEVWNKAIEILTK